MRRIGAVMMVVAAIVLLSAQDGGLRCPWFSESTEPQVPEISPIQAVKGLNLSLVGYDITGDSVLVSVSWSPAFDETGIDHYDWQNVLAQDTTQLQSQASTALTTDTIVVPLPAIEARGEYGFHVRAVDGAGNIGYWSAFYMWAVYFKDIVGPAPPEVQIDTLITVTNDVIAVNVWMEKDSILIGETVQAYALATLRSGEKLCTDTIGHLAVSRPWATISCYDMAGYPPPAALISPTSYAFYMPRPRR